jgi:HEAT repeat protein
LKSYDWGTDPKVLKPIDEAVVATHGDAAARKELESRLAAVLASSVSRDAKDYVCRKLMIIGTAASVPALAELLSEKDHSHMARYALERIPVAEAAGALRDALPKLAGALKVGVIASLGVRRDAASVPALAALLGATDTTVARAAAAALGAIRSAEAAKALAHAKPSAGEAKFAATDATLACAEGLLAGGKRAEALAVYKGLSNGDQPKHVRLAATRGMLACAGKTE